ncbi:MAG: integrase arm-type DNA-binding domain-containing protein [Candidatus Thiodiazotropha sp. (ex Codakia rugifera)]|nr:integrase arm-type DNA-binding domain-containing protein [Candidatus Thiodiazotropha sp. (ex Codakia rugifera)]
MKLTKTAVEQAAIPAAGQVFYRDDQLKGFALRVTSGGAKSFVVEKRINRKVKRKTLGRFGELTAEQARKQAQKFLGQVASGEDPISEKKDQQTQTVTLSEAFELYLKVRSALKETTVRDYRRLMKEIFKDWQDRELRNITKDMVQKRHRDYGKRSQARANNAMRLLKAVFNFARGQYEDSQGHSLFPENPVDRLSHVKAWFRVERRRTLIKKSELPAWFEAVERLREEGDPTSETIADYLILLLLTGLRRSEGMNLQWADVDFVDRTLRVNDTKNREPLILPLSDTLFELLKRREGQHESSYVFPGSTGGRIIEPRKQLFKVIEWSGVSFTLHDLRRTFITIGESLELSQYAIKHLVNHKMPNDVTAGYIVMDPERLRPPMEKITQAILLAAGCTTSSNIVPITMKEHAS